jgi:ketosteroid isomerase-like protein
MELSEVADRAEIEALMVDYCHAVDDRDWDALDRVFTPDAIIDYSEMTPFRGTLAEAKAYLAAAMAGTAACQHIISTSQIRIDGDRAWGRTVCVNPNIVRETGAMFVVGLWYRDEFRRTPDGWRIVHRYEESSWRQDAPAGLLANPHAVRLAWAARGGDPAGPAAAEGFPQPLRETSV